MPEEIHNVSTIAQLISLARVRRPSKSQVFRFTLIHLINDIFILQYLEWIASPHFLFRGIMIPPSLANDRVQFTCDAKFQTIELSSFSLVKWYNRVPFISYPLVHIICSMLGCDFHRSSQLDCDPRFIAPVEVQVNKTCPAFRLLNLGDKNLTVPQVIPHSPFGIDSMILRQAHCVSAFDVMCKKRYSIEATSSAPFVETAAIILLPVSRATKFCSIDKKKGRRSKVRGILFKIPSIAISFLGLFVAQNTEIYLIGKLYRMIGLYTTEMPLVEFQRRVTRIKAKLSANRKNAGEEDEKKHRYTSLSSGVLVGDDFHPIDLFILLFVGVMPPYQTENKALFGGSIFTSVFQSRETGSDPKRARVEHRFGSGAGSKQQPRSSVFCLNALTEQLSSSDAVQRENAMFRFRNVFLLNSKNAFKDCDLHAAPTLGIKGTGSLAFRVFDQVRSNYKKERLPPIQSEKNIIVIECNNDIAVQFRDALTEYNEQHGRDLCVFITHCHRINYYDVIALAETRATFSSLAVVICLVSNFDIISFSNFHSRIIPPSKTRSLFPRDQVIELGISSVIPVEEVDRFSSFSIHSDECHFVLNQGQKDAIDASLLNLMQVLSDIYQKKFQVFHSLIDKVTDLS